MLTILRTSPNDIPSIKEIEIECSLSPWSVHDYLLEVNRRDSIFLTAKENSKYYGFILARLIQHEKIPTKYNLFDKNTAEIYNIGVKENHRHKRIGSKLLKRFLKIIEYKDICEVYLEVRKSNLGAINFYQRHDFEAIGERKNFYIDPIENAVLMKLNLEQPKNA